MPLLRFCYTVICNVLSSVSNPLRVPCSQRNFEHQLLQNVLEIISQGKKVIYKQTASSFRATRLNREMGILKTEKWCTKPSRKDKNKK